LVEDFTDEARDRGAETAFLEVAADNAPARALYAATGWEQTGARRGYYTTPEGTKIDALILRRPLK
jgi:ribosomal-protein-alanine N-acetyltransferase